MNEIKTVYEIEARPKFGACGDPIGKDVRRKVWWAGTRLEDAKRKYDEFRRDYRENEKCQGYDFRLLKTTREVIETMDDEVK